MTSAGPCTPGDARLILTSAKSGAAGIALADTLGTTLQTLGFQDINGAELAGSVLVAFYSLPAPGKRETDVTVTLGLEAVF